MKVYEAAQKALEAVRSGSGPFLLELTTYRFRGHSMGDPERYRKHEEVKKWEESDPIGAFRRSLVERKIASASALDEIDAQALQEVEAAVQFAEVIAGADAGDLYRQRLRRLSGSPRPRRAAPQAQNAKLQPAGLAGGEHMAHITMREAISQALWEEMERDPAVFILGEEVGVWGGSYAVTKGFYDHFGGERVRDTPIAEASIIGAAIGAALVGQTAGGRADDHQLCLRGDGPHRQRGRQAALHVCGTIRAPAW